jgi:hypothetical protein
LRSELSAADAILTCVCVPALTGNSKRMRMLEVRENKRRLKIDEKIVLSNAYVSIYFYFCLEKL